MCVTVDSLAIVRPDAKIGSARWSVPEPLTGLGFGLRMRHGAKVTIIDIPIGDRVIIHPGARVGYCARYRLPSATKLPMFSSSTMAEFKIPSSRASARAMVVPFITR